MSDDQINPEIAYIQSLDREMAILAEMEKVLQNAISEPPSSEEPEPSAELADEVTTDEAPTDTVMGRVMVARTEEEKHHAREILEEDRQRISGGLGEPVNEEPEDPTAFESRLAELKAKYGDTQIW